MRAARRRLLAIDLTWLLVLVTAFVALLHRPDVDRAGADSLEYRLDVKRAKLNSYVVTGVPPAKLEQVKERTTDWHTMTASESLRIAEFSRAARVAGVAVASLRDREHRLMEGEKTIRARSHRVRVLGSYRQLARFLASVSESRGIASVEDLIIEPDDQRTPDLLRASLTVSWYSSDPEAEPPG